LVDLLSCYRCRDCWHHRFRLNVLALVAGYLSARCLNAF
jgi:hypothetical protein